MNFSRVFMDEACPDQIALEPAHWQEWCASAVHPEIIALNVISIADLEIDNDAHEASYPLAEKLNWKVTRFGYQARPNTHGWWVSGADPLNNYERMEWGRFKPDIDTPIYDRKGKQARYLSPGGTPSRLTLLDVPLEIWQQVSDRYGIPIRGKSFWQWVEHFNIPIVICEGEKKAGCLLSLGYATIALPGITGGARVKDANGDRIPAHLIPDLLPFASEGREVYICFDHETKEKTIRDVRRETFKLCNCFSKAGAIPKIISLPGPEKGADDFVVANGADRFEQLYGSATDFKRWDRQRYSRLTFKPHLQLNQQYLGKLNLPASAKLIAIKSAKGTGKTQSFFDIVDEAIGVGQRVLLITHRVQLGQAIADRVGIPYVTELRTEGTGDLLGYGVCVDSLHSESQARFNADHWHDAIVIIDECEQVIWHLLSAETEVKNRRCTILGEIGRLFSNVLNSNGGKVILSDADLSDLSLRFVAGMAGLQEQAIRWINPCVVVNQWKPDQAWNVHHYTQGNPKDWYAALERELDRGGKLFVTTQSQRTKSKHSTQTIESRLSIRFPEKKFLRVDSQSVADPTHEAYGWIGLTSEFNKLRSELGDQPEAKPDDEQREIKRVRLAELKHLLFTRYDAIIASPTIETGVSLDVRGHFTSVWGCFRGVSPENSTRQALSRVREPVDRHIWVSKCGIGRIGNGATALSSLIESQKQMAKLTGKLLFVGIDPDSDELTNPTAFNIWGKMACRINAGMAAYREAVIEGLVAEGHHMIEVMGGVHGSDAIDEEVTQLCQERRQAECQSIAEAEEITDNQYQELEAKKTKTPTEWHKQRKHFLQQRYQVPISPEIVARDDDGWHSKIRLHYYFSPGRHFLKSRDQQTFESLSASKEQGWLPTMNRSFLSVQIEFLNYLGIAQLFDSAHDFASGNKQHDYDNADPVLLQICRRAQQYAWEIRAALGVTVSPKHTPIGIVQSLLGKLGLKLTVDRQEGPRGDRQRIYRFVQPEDDRWQVFSAWLKSHEQIAAQRAHPDPVAEWGGAA